MTAIGRLGVVEDVGAGSAEVMGRHPAQPSQLCASTKGTVEAVSYVQRHAPAHSGGAQGADDRIVWLYRAPKGFRVRPAPAFEHLAKLRAWVDFADSVSFSRAADHAMLVVAPLKAEDLGLSQAQQA